jgi:hypothetical protein
LKFTDGESLICTRAATPAAAKVALLDSEGKIVPELKVIVSEWFERYSVLATKEELIELARVLKQLDQHLKRSRHTQNLCR